jgi:hypothetical protein
MKIKTLMLKIEIGFGMVLGFILVVMLVEVVILALQKVMGVP